MDGRNLNLISKITHPDMTICSTPRFVRCLRGPNTGRCDGGQEEIPQILTDIVKTLGRS